MNRLADTFLIAAFLLLATPAMAEEEHFEAVFGQVQSASPEDLEIKAPFIGSFRGSSDVFDDGKTEFYFVLRYDWWDKDRSFVKYTVSMVIPSQDRSLLRSEGIYGFDRSQQRLYVFGIFSGGMTGRGFIGQFDKSAGTHEIWASSVGPDGVVTWVKDSFEVIDEDHWRNRTLMRRGEETEWRQAHEDTYTRMETAEDA